MFKNFQKSLHGYNRTLTSYEKLRYIFVMLYASSSLKMEKKRERKLFSLILTNEN